MVTLIPFLLLIDALVASILPRKYFKNKLFFAPLVVAGLTAAYQLYQSDQQKKKAKNLAPSNYVPPSVKEAITSQRMQTNAASPGYTRGLQRMQQQTASTIDSAKKIGGAPQLLQQTVADTDAHSKELAKDLEVNNASYQAQSRAGLNNLLQVQGRYEAESMDAYNAAKSALLGASQRNQFNAISGFAENAILSMPDSTFSDKTTADPTATGVPTERSATSMTADDKIADMESQGELLTPSQKAKIRAEFEMKNKYVNPASRRAPIY